MFVKTFLNFWCFVGISMVCALQEARAGSLRIVNHLGQNVLIWLDNTNSDEPVLYFKECEIKKYDRPRDCEALSVKNEPERTTGQTLLKDFLFNLSRYFEVQWDMESTETFFEAFENQDRIMKDYSNLPPSIPPENLSTDEAYQKARHRIDYFLELVQPVLLKLLGEESLAIYVGSAYPGLGEMFLKALKVSRYKVSRRVAEYKIPSIDDIRVVEAYGLNAQDREKAFLYAKNKREWLRDGTPIQLLSDKVFDDYEVFYDGKKEVDFFWDYFQEFKIKTKIHKPHWLRDPNEREWLFFQTSYRQTLEFKIQIGRSAVVENHLRRNEMDLTISPFSVKDPDLFFEKLCREEALQIDKNILECRVSRVF